MLIALLIATPFFIVFGSLSDRWGRKNIMLAGMLLGVLLYRPIFRQLHHIADPQLKTASAKTKEDRKSETLQGNLSGPILTITNTREFGDGSRFKEITRQQAGMQQKRNGNQGNGVRRKK